MGFRSLKVTIKVKESLVLNTGSILGHWMVSILKDLQMLLPEQIT